MPTPTRLYLIRNTETGDERLVRAPNASRALAHITRTSYTAEAASQEQLVALLTGETPTEIEDATREPVAPEAEPERDAA